MKSKILCGPYHRIGYQTICIMANVPGHKNSEQVKNATSPIRQVFFILLILFFFIFHFSYSFLTRRTFSFHDENGQLIEQ